MFLLIPTCMLASISSPVLAACGVFFKNKICCKLAACSSLLGMKEDTYFEMGKRTSKHWLTASKQTSFKNAPLAAFCLVCSSGLKSSCQSAFVEHSQFERLCHIALHFIALYDDVLSAACLWLISYLNLFQKKQDEGTSSKKADATARRRAVKEAKSIPNLIFKMEQYDNTLNKLSVKSKFEIKEKFVLPKSRDFRYETFLKRKKAMLTTTTWHDAINRWTNSKLLILKHRNSDSHVETTAIITPLDWWLSFLKYLVLCFSLTFCGLNLFLSYSQRYS